MCHIVAVRVVGRLEPELDRVRVEHLAVRGRHESRARRGVAHEWVCAGLDFIARNHSVAVRIREAVGAVEWVETEVLLDLITDSVAVGIDPGRLLDSAHDHHVVVFYDGRRACVRCVGNLNSDRERSRRVVRVID